MAYVKPEKELPEDKQIDVVANQEDRPEGEVLAKGQEFNQMQKKENAYGITGAPPRDIYHVENNERLVVPGSGPNIVSQGTDRALSPKELQGVDVLKQAREESRTQGEPVKP